MTPEEQRIAIAKACGWKFHGVINGKLLMWPPIHGDACEPPDYLNDLNAMHEAEKVFESVPYTEGWQLYFQKLIAVTGNTYVDGKLLITAEAVQRAEAYLRARNLWETNAE